MALATMTSNPPDSKRPSCHWEGRWLRPQRGGVLSWLAPVGLVHWGAIDPSSPALQSVDAVLKPQHPVLGDVLDAAPNPSHRPWAAISPRKSMEGAVAGFLFAVGASLLARAWFAPFLELRDAIVLGVLVGIFGQILDSTDR